MAWHDVPPQAHQELGSRFAIIGFARARHHDPKYIFGDLEQHQSTLVLLVQILIKSSTKIKSTKRLKTKRPFSSVVRKA